MNVLRAYLGVLVAVLSFLAMTPAWSEPLPQACCAGVADLPQLSDAGDDRNAPDCGITERPRARDFYPTSQLPLASVMPAGRPLSPPHPPPD